MDTKNGASGLHWQDRFGGGTDTLTNDADNPFAKPGVFKSLP